MAAHDTILAPYTLQPSTDDDIEETNVATNTAPQNAWPHDRKLSSHIWDFSPNIKE